MHIESFIEQLLSPTSRQESADLKHWHAEFKNCTLDVSDSIQRAILGGRHSLCVGFAFASGYQSAIEQLFGLRSGELASFCVSEAKGNHPKAIESALTKSDEQLTLSGHKTFVSGGCDAQRLFIACKDARSTNEKPYLKVISLSSENSGIEINPMPELPFVPQVTHGQVKMESVALNDSDILPGDGYINYIKPFRTCEDIHVSAAVCGYLLAEAVEGKWPSILIEQYLSLILAFTAIAEMDLARSTTHLSLAGLRTQMEQIIDQSDQYFQNSSPFRYQDWQRDRALLNIAQKAHEKRTDKAWSTLITG
jgi:acyl-CoA dehydrogenase